MVGLCICLVLLHLTFYYLQNSLQSRLTQDTRALDSTASHDSDIVECKTKIDKSIKAKNHYQTS